MIKEDQVKSFNEKGYLVIENLLPENILKNLQKVTDDFVEKSRTIKKNDDIYDLSDDHTSDNPAVRRLKNPHINHPAYDNIIKSSLITDILSNLIGNNIRLEHTKLNFKSARGGEAIEWHQDWAFYPHTNDDLLAVGIYLEDCKEINGPLKVLSGSHRKELYDHHDGGSFVGKINHKKEKLNINKAISLIGQAGTVTFHHVRTIHGSGLNLTLNKRPLILFGYVAVDSWPLTYDSGSSEDPNSNLEIYNKLIIKGKPTLYPRIEKTPIKIPLPRNSDSIYDLQKEKKKN